MVEFFVIKIKTLAIKFLIMLPAAALSHECLLDKSHKTQEEIIYLLQLYVNEVMHYFCRITIMTVYN